MRKTIPFSPPSLPLAPQRSECADGVLRAHDLEIDTGARTVTRAGRPIRLTPREYTLLVFLMARRGRVVTRSLLWQQLCGGRVGPRSNMVDVYIRHLRNKIDDDFDRPLILTSRCWGYLLRGDDLPA
jgi:two-component system OmpR family response regulator